MFGVLKLLKLGEGDDGGSDWIFWAVLAALGSSLLQSSVRQRRGIHNCGVR